MASVPLWLARFDLCDQQWRDIQHASRLCNEMRASIERALGQYQHLRHAITKQPSAAQTRTKLRRIAKLADDVIKAIVGGNANVRAALRRRARSPSIQPQIIFSGANADVLAAVMPSGSGTPRRDALQELCQWLCAIERLRSCFADAARALPKESRGAHKAFVANQWLVSELDASLFHCTGRHVSREKSNHYVTLCFAAVDRKIGAGSIDEAIRAYRRLRPAVE